MPPGRFILERKGVGTLMEEGARDSPLDDQVFHRGNVRHLKRCRREALHVRGMVDALENRLGHRAESMAEQLP